MSYLYSNSNDVGGNILKKFIYPFTTGALGTPTSTINYTYNSTWKDQMASYDGKAITYDAIGNPLTYDGYTFTWEAGRQLSSINKTGLSMSFKYNDEGIRTQKTVNGVTTTYHVLGDKVTYETNGTDGIYYSYDSENKLVSIKLNGVEYYYIRNTQGDIISLVDGNGAQVVSYSYDSWGKLISIDGTLKDSLGKKNPYRYRGYRYDEETGFYYLNSRYYNPEWGRFLNADAIAGGIGAVLTQNAYAYCQNQPINHKDPSGYIWETALDIGSIGWSAYDLATRPSWQNARYLAWDVGAAAIPFVPGSYVARAGKIAKIAAKRKGNLLVKGKGFSSFYKLKKYLGSAGKGNAWHHIVEQTSSNIKKFGVESIHNTANIIKLPHGKGSIHAKISGYYSSKQPFTGGKTVRQWISTKSFKEQYKFGIKILKQFGAID